MALVRLRERAQITLPQEVREALQLEEGDHLEAVLVEGGVLLKPVAVVERAQSRERLRAGRKGSRWIGPGSEPDDEALMREVVELIKEVRRDRREGGR